jgi:hypothetical protein
VRQTAFRQGIQRNHAFLLMQSGVLQARAEPRLPKLHRTDSAGNSVSMPGQKPGQVA